jgi:surface antigen/uncharacterized protein YukE
MARLGMDADQVENAGRSLKDRAAAIDSIVAGIDKVVKSLPSIWEGSDSQKFVEVWWPDHRKQLVAASVSVEGLGQSALNNASEQRNASGSGSSSVTPGIWADRAHDLPGNQAGPDGSYQSGTAHAGDGSLPPGGGTAEYRAFRDLTQEWNPAKGWYQDKNGNVVDNCTSWADFRREEIDPSLALAHGNGGQMAGNLGGSTTTPATLGALASYYPSDSPQFGHVMVVEEIKSPGVIRVSEMNYAGSSDVHYRDWTQGTDGLWRAGGKGTGYPLVFSP